MFEGIFKLWEPAKKRKEKEMTYISAGIMTVHWNKVCSFCYFLRSKQLSVISILQDYN